MGDCHRRAARARPAAAAQVRRACCAPLRLPLLLCARPAAPAPSLTRLSCRRCTPHSAPDECPQEVLDILTQCLHLDPGMRPTAMELVQLISNAPNTPPASAVPSGPWRRGTVVLDGRPPRSPATAGSGPGPGPQSAQPPGSPGPAAGEPAASAALPQQELGLREAEAAAVTAAAALPGRLGGSHPSGSGSAVAEEAVGTPTAAVGEIALLRASLDNMPGPHTPDTLPTTAQAPGPAGATATDGAPA